MTQLADFYSPHTTPAQLRAHGYDGGSFYVSHVASKNSVPAEILAMRADGLIVGLNFEDQADQALRGETQGRMDALFARDCALALGYPAGKLIFFSVDFEATSSQAGAVIAYFRGVVAELGEAYTAGVYGSFDVVEWVHAALGLIGWQTAAWSSGRLSAHAVLYQDSFGAQFDTDRLLTADVALWGLEDVTAAPAEPPASKAAAAAPAAAKTPAAGADTEEMHTFLVEAVGDASGGVDPGFWYIVDLALGNRRPIGKGLPPAEAKNALDLLHALYLEVDAGKWIRQEQCSWLAALPLAPD